LKLRCTKGSRAAGTPLKTMNTNHNSDTPDGEPEASPTASKNLKDSGIKRLFWSTLLLAAGLALFLSAGFWQLDRAAQKRAFITSFNDATQTPALSAPVDTNAGEMLYRRFSLRGNYLPQRQVLLDNMVSEGEVGYQVLTPFKLDTELGGQVLLVNRGWAKGTADRLQLPNVDVANNAREVRGRLAYLPAPGIRLDAPLPDVTSIKWPLPMTWPTTAQISTLLQKPLLEWQLLLDDDQPDGYRRNWQPEIMRPETHLGYAVQWFSFAALALIIYTLLHFRSARKRRETNT
jgi:surfeit locus 1 family protein